MKWNSVKLQRILDVSDPGVWGTEDLENGVSILRSTNMNNNGTLDFTNLTFRAVPEKKRRDKTLISGDIILERSGGGPKQPIGRVCYFDGDARPHLFGNFCQRLRANSELCESRFLFWFLYHFHATGQTQSYQKQTTGIRNLEYKRYIAQLVTLPPPSEQRRIVEILDQADALRKKRAEADAKAARILPALFYKMFGDPATNPKGWPTGTFKDLFSQDKDIVDEVAGANQPYLGLEHIESESGRILITESYASTTEVRGVSFQFDTHHVLYGKLRPYLNKVALPSFSGRCSTELVPLLPRGDSPREFIAAYLRLPFVVNAAMSTNKGSRMPRTDMHLLMNMTVPIPPIPLQKKYAAAFHAVQATHIQRNIATEKIEEIFNVLLHRAFTGDLTANWREAHMKELLAEMETQAKALL
jgi:type I restriction enzyme S subunit